MRMILPTIHGKKNREMNCTTDSSYRCHEAAVQLPHRTVGDLDSRLQTELVEGEEKPSS
jgi:hypothetical protein